MDFSKTAASPDFSGDIRNFIKHYTHVSVAGVGPGEFTYACSGPGESVTVDLHREPAVWSDTQQSIRVRILASRSNGLADLHPAFLSSIPNREMIDWDVGVLRAFPG